MTSTESRNPLDEERHDTAIPTRDSNETREPSPTHLLLFRNSPEHHSSRVGSPVSYPLVGVSDVSDPAVRQVESNNESPSYKSSELRLSPPYLNYGNTEATTTAVLFESAGTELTPTSTTSSKSRPCPGCREDNEQQHWVVEDNSNSDVSTTSPPRTTSPTSLTPAATTTTTPKQQQQRSAVDMYLDKVLSKETSAFLSRSFSPTSTTKTPTKPPPPSESSVGNQADDDDDDSTNNNNADMFSLVGQFVEKVLGISSTATNNDASSIFSSQSRSQSHLRSGSEVMHDENEKKLSTHAGSRSVATTTLHNHSSSHSRSHSSSSATTSTILQSHDEHEEEFSSGTATSLRSYTSSSEDSMEGLFMSLPAPVPSPVHSPVLQPPVIKEEEYEEVIEEEEELDEIESVLSDDSMDRLRFDDLLSTTILDAASPTPVPDQVNDFAPATPATDMDTVIATAQSSDHSACGVAKQESMAQPSSSTHSRSYSSSFSAESQHLQNALSEDDEDSLGRVLDFEYDGHDGEISGDLIESQAVLNPPIETGSSHMTPPSLSLPHHETNEEELFEQTSRVHDDDDDHDDDDHDDDDDNADVDVAAPENESMTEDDAEEEGFEVVRSDTMASNDNDLNLSSTGADVPDVEVEKNTDSEGDFAGDDDAYSGPFIGIASKQHWGGVVPVAESKVEAFDNICDASTPPSSNEELAITAPAIVEANISVEDGLSTPHLQRDEPHVYPLLANEFVPDTDGIQTLQATSSSSVDTEKELLDWPRSYSIGPPVLERDIETPKIHNHLSITEEKELLELTSRDHDDDTDDAESENESTTEDEEEGFEVVRSDTITSNDFNLSNSDCPDVEAEKNTVPCNDITEEIDAFGDPNAGFALKELKEEDSVVEPNVEVLDRICDISTPPSNVRLAIVAPFIVETNDSIKADESTPRLQKLDPPDASSLTEEVFPSCSQESIQSPLAGDDSKTETQVSTLLKYEGLANFAPAIAAAKATIEANLSTPRRQRIDPPAADSSSINTLSYNPISRSSRRDPEATGELNPRISLHVSAPPISSLRESSETSSSTSPACRSLATQEDSIQTVEYTMDTNAAVSIADSKTILTSSPDEDCTISVACDVGANPASSSAEPESMIASSPDNLVIEAHDDCVPSVADKVDTIAFSHSAELEAIATHSSADDSSLSVANEVDTNAATYSAESITVLSSSPAYLGNEAQDDCVPSVVDEVDTIEEAPSVELEATSANTPEEDSALSVAYEVDTNTATSSRISSDDADKDDGFIVATERNETKRVELVPNLEPIVQSQTFEITLAPMISIGTIAEDVLPSPTKTKTQESMPILQQLVESQTFEITLAPEASAGVIAEVALSFPSLSTDTKCPESSFAVESAHIEDDNTSCSSCSSPFKLVGVLPNDPIAAISMSDSALQLMDSEEMLMPQIQTICAEVGTNKETFSENKTITSQQNIDETIRKLWETIQQQQPESPKMRKNVSGDYRSQGYQQFVSVIHKTLPLFDGRVPTPLEKAQHHLEALHQGIPVVMTNTLVESLFSLSQCEETLGLTPLPKFILELSESKHPIARKEALIRRLLMVKEAEKRRDVVIYSLATLSNGEAVEIDLSGEYQFALNEYESLSDDSDGEPWWKVTEKMSKAFVESRDSDDDDDDVELAPSSTREDNDCDTDSGAFSSNSSKENKVRKMSKMPSLELEEEEEVDIPKYPKLLQPPELLGTASSSTSSMISYTRSSGEEEEEIWARKRDIAMWPKGPNGGWLSRITKNNWIKGPKSINAVKVTTSFVCPSFVKRHTNPGTKQWALPHARRISSHKGFSKVNSQSLYDSTNLVGDHHPLDFVQWEIRDVKQRFLHEQSISYNRIWFGTTKKVYGNVRRAQPTACLPKSMEMPMKRVATGCEWTEEWYKNPWENLSLAPTQSLSATAESAGRVREKKQRQMIPRSKNKKGDHEVAWEETPQCGTFHNVNLKIGERISRVTPDITSSLRQSRWRKKFFPKGTFPY